MVTVTRAAAPTDRRSRRPFALLVLAGLLLFKAVLAAAVVVGAGIAAGGTLPDAIKVVPELGAVAEIAPGTRVVLLLLAALLVAAAVGLIGLRRRGWVLAMVLTGMFVAIDIGAFLQGDANDLWMLLNIITVFYLNQSDVRAALGVNPEPILHGVEMP